jgi:sulfide:quinone oxidoreductase
VTPAGASAKLRVTIAGGGFAAVEALLALHALAPERTTITVLAPNSELVHRAMTIGEPFAYPEADRYALAPIVRAAGAELIVDELAWVDADKRIAHTASDTAIEYDALVLALGARPRPRYEHAITVDDCKLGETMRGLIQDVEEGYVERLAFVSPGRMAWPLPLYELALMTAGRAYDMNVALAITIVTPEDAPLAIFGATVTNAVAELLERARIKTIQSAYAEIPHPGEISINPGNRHLQVDRIVALPELYGPGVRGVPLSEHGFYHVDAHCKLVGSERIYAAGDATEFAVKFGGIAAQQADAAAEAIAALAGADVTPEPFRPVMHGILLTAEEPRYLTARITGGQGFDSEISDTPTWSPTKIAAKYLAAYLERLDSTSAPT